MEIYWTNDYLTLQGCFVGFVTWVRKKTTLACLDDLAIQDKKF
jgi:hypothetical protein